MLVDQSRGAWGGAALPSNSITSESRALNLFVDLVPCYRNVSMHGI